MTYYRLYLLNGSHIESAVEIQAANDQEAIGIAGAGPHPQARELWCGARRVQVFAAAPTSPES